MGYGKVIVLQLINDLMNQGRLKPNQYQALITIPYMESPTIYAQLIDVRGKEELVVADAATNSGNEPVYVPLLPLVV